VKFTPLVTKAAKISHEHTYWDQAGVPVHVGLLDPTVCR
jgi:hypothetical protein